MTRSANPQEQWDELDGEDCDANVQRGGGGMTSGYSRVQLEYSTIREGNSSAFVTTLYKLVLGTRDSSYFEYLEVQY